MRITKCDLCKNVIEESGNSVTVGRGWLSRFEFCEKCAKPILRFLKRQKLLKKEGVSFEERLLS